MRQGKCIHAACDESSILTSVFRSLERSTMTTMLRAGRNRASAFYAAIHYRRRYDLLLVLTLWGIVLPIGKAIAGQYKLIQGSGLPVCEAYRRNFESRHESEPM